MTTGAISPGGSGGGASGRPASAEPSRYIDADDPRPAGSTPETAPTENPSEWRKKHREPPPFENFSHLEGYNKTKNLYPPGQNLASIERGRKIYDTSCYQCHGKTGAPQTNNPTLLRFNMADLRKPRQYKFGSSARGIYRSTAFGVGGPPMGFYKDALTENQIWDVTNYVLSLQESNF